MYFQGTVFTPIVEASVTLGLCIIIYKGAKVKQKSQDTPLMKDNMIWLSRTFSINKMASIFKKQIYKIKSRKEALHTNLMILRY